MQENITGLLRLTQQEQARATVWKCTKCGDTIHAWDWAKHLYTHGILAPAGDEITLKAFRTRSRLFDSFFRKV